MKQVKIMRSPSVSLNCSRFRRGNVYLEILTVIPSEGINSRYAKVLIFFSFLLTYQR